MRDTRQNIKLTCLIACTCAFVLSCIALCTCNGIVRNVKKSYLFIDHTIINLDGTPFGEAAQWITGENINIVVDVRDVP